MEAPHPDKPLSGETTEEQTARLEQERYEKCVAAIFAFIDKDGGGELSKDEIQEWFESSALVGLMTFQEFYRPLAKLDINKDGSFDMAEFVLALNNFRKYSSMWAIAFGTYSFYFGIVFVVAAIAFCVNEILLGEQVQETTDMSWRIVEVFVWFGFCLGMFGYFRVYLSAIEQEGTDFRDQISSFESSVLATLLIFAVEEEGTEAQVEERIRLVRENIEMQEKQVRVSNKCAARGRGKVRLSCPRISAVQCQVPRVVRPDIVLRKCSCISAVQCQEVQVSQEVYQNSPIPSRSGRRALTKRSTSNWRIF